MNSKEQYGKKLNEQIALANKLNDKYLGRIACVCTWADSELDVKPIITKMDKRMNDIYIEYYYNLIN